MQEAMKPVETIQDADGREKFFHELQRFDIDITRSVLTYNGFHSVKLYAVFLQNAFLKFNTDLYAHLHTVSNREERIAYLKDLKAYLTELDEQLLQTRDIFSLLQSLLANGEIKNYRSIIPRLKEMNVHINTQDALPEELEDIDLLSFIDSQISYSYKAISLIYNMITLELGVPSAYAQDNFPSTYKLRWKGSMRQLTELFVELQKKGWIAAIEDKMLEPAVKSIVNLFDIERTRLPEDEQEYQSMAEILKGVIDKKGKRLHDRLYTKNYQPIFDKIKPISISQKKQ